MSDLLSVAEAGNRILAGVRPIDSRTVAIEDAIGAVLADDLAARLDQPPEPVSSMDGYAGHLDADAATAEQTWRIVGEAAAGHPFHGRTLQPGEAVRIFTGGVVPEGADCVIAQEDAVDQGEQSGRQTVRFSAKRHPGQFIRPKACDFSRGDALIPSGTRLDARALTLAAAMGYGKVWVRRRPQVAILATGDELVAPGVPPGPGQIVSSIPVGLAALVRAAGADPVLLGIARDTRESLAAQIARTADTDILVTIGGASVGDHDLVQAALADAGMALDFWRIAMRPGKPLMFGRLGGRRVLGLPGNPVSALICGRLFLVPLIEHLLGIHDPGLKFHEGIAATPIEANGAREHYMRAIYAPLEGEPTRSLEVMASQDSSLMATLFRADALIVRPPHAPAAAAGDPIRYLPIDF